MNPKEFKKLQKLWYKKLKDTGFVDAENPKNGLLNENSSKHFSKHHTRYGNLVDSNATYIFETVAEYYRFASGFLYSHNFKSSREKLIWALHTEGLSEREIEASIAPLLAPPNKRSYIQTIIKDLKAIMFKEVGLK